MDIRYFRKLGVCRCGKPATGWLMGARNDEYGVACEPCAKKLIAKSDREAR